MSIDERIEALKLAMERIRTLAAKTTEDSAALLDLARQDGEKIRALLSIAESRQRG
jgi:hypothetical protein